MTWRTTNPSRAHNVEQNSHPLQVTLDIAQTNAARQPTKPFTENGGPLTPTKAPESPTDRLSGANLTSQTCTQCQRLRRVAVGKRPAGGYPLGLLGKVFCLVVIWSSCCLVFALVRALFVFLFAWCVVCVLVVRVRVCCVRVFDGVGHCVCGCCVWLWARTVVAVSNALPCVGPAREDD